MSGNSVSKTVSDGAVAILLLYYLIWVFTGFYGGLQLVWYLCNRSQLKGIPYTQWFAGHRLLWMYVVLMSVALWFSSWFVVNGWRSHVDLSLGFVYLYGLVALLGLWYPYALVKAIFLKSRRVFVTSLKRSWQDA